MSCAAKASTLGAGRCSVVLEPPAHRTGKTIENHEQDQRHSAIEHFDVLIVGAGISGVGGAYHLTKQCPGTSFVVLEAQESFGGTWLTHRYPGIRSDSDLYTFGYRFKPWTGAPIATAAEILSYMGEVIDENDLGPHIRYRHRIVVGALVERGQSLDDRGHPDGHRAKRSRFTANFLWMCQGYYRHSRGLHARVGRDGDASRAGSSTRRPGRRTSTTRARRSSSSARAPRRRRSIPAIAADCAHVTMLQRSPTYFSTGRNAIELADELRELEIDETWIHEIVRRKILHDQAVFTRRSFTEPEVVKQELLAGVRAYLGPDYDVETHFTPRYRPWRQRIAFVPDGDLFQAIRAGKASVVTDEIERFTETGILLKSGKVLEADIIVTATGFNLNVLGDIDFTIDGKPLDFSDTVTYRGMMFTGVPNMAWVFGYFRASWTLRADLVADFVCRLLNHMKEKGAKKVDAGASARGQGHAAAALDRPGELQSRLPHARHAPAAEARRQARMAAHPGLLDREGRVARHRPRRRRVRLRVSRRGLVFLPRVAAASGPFQAVAIGLDSQPTRYAEATMKITDVTLTLFAWDNIPPTTYGTHTGQFAGSSALGLLRIDHRSRASRATPSSAPR